MIDVPVEVKDALREGTYKKNYRFVVGEEEWHEVGSIETIGWYSPSTNYGDNKMFTIRDTKTYRFVVDDDEHDTYTLYYYKSSDPNWRTLEPISRNTWEFTNDAYSAYVEINSSSGNLYSPVSVQNYYAETIDNNNLVSESVNIDERMCSGDTLKFGLCEGSSLEFQYFGKPNITGERIQAFVDVDYGADEPYTIPMGFFDVKKCSRQASTGIIKATCYNKLQSEYLDAKANELLLSSVDDPQTDITIYSIKKVLLEHFQIDPYEQTEKQRDNTLPVFMNTITKSVKLSDLTSDGGPINYFSLLPGATAQGKTLNTNTVLSLQIRSVGIQWSISESDVNYYQILQSIHDFSSLSESFVDYVISLLNSCPLTKTGNTIISEIKNINEGDSHGWGHLFGFNYYTSAEGMKYYNDYAYKNQNDGTYRVNGTSRDFMLQLYGKKNITIYAYVPFLIDINIRANNIDYGIYSVQLFGDTPISYRGSGGSTKYYPQFTYEDGTFITQPTTPDFVMPFEDWLGLYEINGISQADLTKIIPESSPEFTLREITTASYETVCQFGQLSRVTDLFSGVELNHSRLYPSDTLYPSDSLYPSGAAASGFRSMYSKLWADEGNVHKWRYLIITYKGLNGDDQEEDFTLQRTINADGTDDYNMSDNWLFRNLVWTAEQVGAYADAMVAKMQDVTWFPFEMWCAGLPYIETGDEIEIPLGEHSYTSYVLQRQLKGIQNLQDTYINGTLDIF